MQKSTSRRSDRLSASGRSFHQYDRGRSQYTQSVGDSLFFSCKYIPLEEVSSLPLTVVTQMNSRTDRRTNIRRHRTPKPDSRTDNSVKSEPRCPLDPVYAMFHSLNCRKKVSSGIQIAQAGLPQRLSSLTGLGGHTFQFFFLLHVHARASGTQSSLSKNTVTLRFLPIAGQLLSARQRFSRSYQTFCLPLVYIHV